MPPNPLRNAIREARGGLSSLCATGEGGFTLIEVLVAAVIVIVMALAVLSGLDATIRRSGDLRLHADAQALAQQDQNRLRGLNVDELSNLTKTLPAITLDGVQFTVQESATYVSDSTGAASCTTPATDYLKTASTVTWTNMGSRAPVTVTSILTPPIGSVSASNGALAVSVLGPDGAGLSGISVALSGPSTAGGVTDANGCVLFGDLPAGTYNASAWSSIGTYVDRQTGGSVTASSPDVKQQGVVGGGTSGLEFDIGLAGSITYTFQSTIASPGAVGVVAYNTGLTANFYRMCTLANGTSCPAVNNGDTMFPWSDWSQLAGTSQIVATPLYPFTGAYTTYAGTCSANAPDQYGGTDVTAAVPPGQNRTVLVTVPAMNIQVYSGTGTGAQGLPVPPAGLGLWIKDTGCGVRYIGYPDLPSAKSAPLSAGQGIVLMNSAYQPSNTTNGWLLYPGMPYGTYNVCVHNGTKYWAATAQTNGKDGRTVTFYIGAGGAAKSGEASVC